MSSTDYQPTSWMLEAFGADSVDVAAALARAAASAQADGHDAKTGSRLRTNEAYGAATWISFAHHVAAELEELGAEVVQPAGCRYPVAAVNTTLVLAVKLAASSKGIDDMKIPSTIRQRILRLSPVEVDTPLNFGDDYDLVDAEGRVVEDSEFGTATRAVLVVMEGSDRSGVERIYIGDVRVGADGAVLWVYRELLPTTVAGADDAGLVALDLEQPADSFAAGDAPEAPLELVTDDDEGTGTDGATDDES
jgi:hypothetical protein